jgi:hypothetical protein
MSDADNLVPGDTNAAGDIFVYDRVNGTTVRVSVSSDGAQQDNWTDMPPIISANGRFIAFESLATNLVPGDTNNGYDVFVHDRDADGNGIFDETGPGQRSTIRVSQRADGGQVNASPINFDPVSTTSAMRWPAGSPTTVAASSSITPAPFSPATRRSRSTSTCSIAMRTATV